MGSCRLTSKYLESTNKLKYFFYRTKNGVNIMKYINFVRYLKVGYLSRSTGIWMKEEKIVRNDKPKWVGKSSSHSYLWLVARVLALIRQYSAYDDQEEQEIFLKIIYKVILLLKHENIRAIRNTRDIKMAKRQIQRHIITEGRFCLLAIKKFRLYGK